MEREQFTVSEHGVNRRWRCRGCGRVWLRRLHQGEPALLVSALAAHRCMKWWALRNRERRQGCKGLR